jgi:hypothetical protein
MLRNLTQGSRGPDVVALQQGLNLRKLPQDQALVEDGVFGPKTRAAVIQFQQRNQLTADGIVGPKTRNTLFPLAVVTVRALGMRLQMPSLTTPRPSYPNLLPGTLTLGSDPQPNPSPLNLNLPPLSPSVLGYQPQPYPWLTMPIASPLLAPPPLLPNLTIPVHHFEVQPGTSVSLSGGRADVSFGLTVSGVVMIGPEDGRHQEFSSGIITSTPGLFNGGDWTVGWFAQLTHVEQLGRASHWSWQPNAQVVAGHGSLPFLSATASPAVVQFDATESISISIGGPSVTALYSPSGGTISWGLASFGIIGKF